MPLYLLLSPFDDRFLQFLERPKLGYDLCHLVFALDFFLDQCGLLLDELRLLELVADKLVNEHDLVAQMITEHAEKEKIKS